MGSFRDDECSGSESCANDPSPGVAILPPVWGLSSDGPGVIRVDGLLSTGLIRVDRSSSAASSTFSKLLTKLVVSGRLSFAELVVTRVLSGVRVFAELMVDKLLSTELVVERPLRILFTELGVDRLLSTELLADRPPSATAPASDADYRTVNRATPIYGRPSSTEPGAAKSRGVRVRAHVRGFP